MSSLKMRIENENNEIKIKFEGSIDEDSNFDSLSNLDSEKIVLDVEKVSSINSSGIRNWLKWIESLGSHELTLMKVPRVFIDQVNLVEGFIPKKTRIQSCFVPYYCEATSEEKNVLYEVPLESSELEKVPDKIQEGEKVFEIDIFPKKYFAFLNQFVG